MPAANMPCPCILRRYRAFLAVLLAALSLFIISTLVRGPVNAQSAGENAFIIRTADAALDESAVRAATQPLIDRGARVVVYFVQSGGASDFLSRLEDNGFGSGQSANDDVIALYVSVNDRYSEIRWGEDFDSQLSNNNLRSDVMNPQLRAADYTLAFVDTLTALDEVLAGTRTSVRTDTDEENTSGGTVVLCGFLLFLPGIFIYCMITGRCKSTGSSDHSSGSSYGSSAGSSPSFDSGGGGSDGGSWND
ncbi:MAG: hypothetical protein OHK0046_43480 [Anaerolineae bacterium]